MNKRNKVKHLNKLAEHRNAMLNNMVTSLFHHERITSTLAKAKVAKQMAEKLITRARENSTDALNQTQKLHNLRIAQKIVKDKEVLYKLFYDIAPRFLSRPGGYTRVLKIGRRESDASEMAILELVVRKELATLKDERKEARARIKPRKKVSQKKEKPEAKKEKKEPKKEVKETKAKKEKK